MRVWTSEDAFDLESCVAALGMFDGVHMGHQALINRARTMAKRLETACVVYTFDRHPLALLCPERAPRQLTTLEERLARLERLGVDGVLVKGFSAEYAATEPEVFVEEMVRKLRVRGIVAGFNYSFGAGGRGDAALLCSEGARLGCECEIVEAVKDGEDTISSTLIRRLLESGEMARAGRLMRLEVR